MNNHINAKATNTIGLDLELIETHITRGRFKHKNVLLQVLKSAPVSATQGTGWRKKIVFYMVIYPATVPPPTQ